MLQANPVNPLCARLFSLSAPIEAYPVFGSISLHRNDGYALSVIANGADSDLVLIVPSDEFPVPAN